MLNTVQSFIQISLPVTIIVVLVLLLVVARPDRDDAGNGLYATYLSVVGISALYLVLVLGVTCVSAVVTRILVEPASPNNQGLNSDFSMSGATSLLYGVGPGNSDQLVQTAVLFGLMAGAAAIVLAFHVRRRQELAASDGFAGSAAERVDRAYAATVCFVAVIIGITALGLAGYGVFRIVAPSVTGTNHSMEQEQGVADLVAFGALLAFTLLLFRTYFWSLRDSDLPEPEDEMGEPVELS